MPSPLWRPGQASAVLSEKSQFPDGPFPPSILAKIGNMQARTAKCLFQARGASQGAAQELNLSWHLFRMPAPEFHFFRQSSDSSLLGFGKIVSALGSGSA